MLFPWMTGTYFIVTRSVFAVLCIGTFVTLIYKGKFHELSSDNKTTAILLPICMMLPHLGEFLAAVLALFGIIGLLCYGVEKADQLSKARSLVLRAEAAKDAPSSGQLDVADNEAGKLTISTREQLGVAPRKGL